MDLRQRRKLETTKLIHEAAVALARDHGVEGATIEAICEAAGISQRTFFNYFPFKEAVFVFPRPPLPDEAVARFAAANGDLLGDLIDLMVAQAVEMQGSLRDGALMREIAEAHPRLMPLQMAEFQKFEVELQELVALRLGGNKDDGRSATVAGAIIGAMRTTIDRWRANESADLARLVRESLEGFVETVRSTRST